MGQAFTSPVGVGAQGAEMFNLLSHPASWGVCVPGTLCPSFTHCKSFQRRGIAGLALKPLGSAREEQ